jgi:hypothetical protein
VTLPDVADLTRPDGLYSDPDKVTELARFFRSANVGVAASIIVHTSPALLIGFTVSSVAAQFIQVFDALALPADTAVPTLSFAVAATNHLAVNYALAPRGFRNGIVICNSSTQHAKTIGSADCIFDVQYL